MYQWLKTPGIWVLWHGQDREGYSVRHQSSCQNKRGQIWELHGWENHTNTHVIDTPWGVCSYIGAWDATAWMKIDTKCCYHFLTLFIATWMQPWKFSRSLLPSISFVCLCLLKLNRFPKRKKKKKSTVENYPISKGLYMAWRMGDIWSSEEVPHLIFFFMEDILKHL